MHECRSRCSDLSESRLLVIGSNSGLGDCLRPFVETAYCSVASTLRDRKPVLVGVLNLFPEDDFPPRTMLTLTLSPAEVPWLWQIMLSPGTPPSMKTTARADVAMDAGSV